MTSKCTPEFNDKTKSMMDELGKLKAQAAEVSKNIARERALNKQSEAMKEKIATGDTSRPPKREPVQYDERVHNALAERNRLRKQVDALIEKGRLKNRSIPEKIADTAIKVQRLFILSHISALQKLPVAAVVKIITSTAEEGVGSLIKHIPGIKQVAEKAPRHGAGLSFHGDVIEGAKGIGAAFRKGGGFDQLLHGADAIDNAYGDKHASSAEWANLSGRVHSFMKEPAKLHEFYRSFYKRSQHAYQQELARTGSEEKAQAHMDQPSTQFMIGEAAYKDSMEAIMQGDNAVIDATDGWLRHISNSSVGGAAFEKLFNLMVPIKKVPANIVKEASSYAVGGPKALVASRGVFKKLSPQEIAAGVKSGFDRLSPQQADYIMKNLKKQGVGLALMFAGFLAGSSVLGGVEKPLEDDRKGAADYYKRLSEKKPLAGHIRVGETDLNANFSHAAPMSVMQAGAEYRAMREKEGNHSFFGDLRDMLQIAGNYALGDSPVVGSLLKTYKYAEKNRKSESMLGNTIAGAVVPGAVQDYAKFRDYDPSKDKNTNSKLGHFLDMWGGQFSAKTRHSSNIPEDVMKAVPGQREKVPK